MDSRKRCSLVICAWHQVCRDFAHVCNVRSTWFVIGCCSLVFVRLRTLHRSCSAYGVGKRRVLEAAIERAVACELRDPKAHSIYRTTWAVLQIAHARDAKDVDDIWAEHLGVVSVRRAALEYSCPTSKGTPKAPNETKRNLHWRTSMIFEQLAASSHPRC